MLTARRAAWIIAALLVAAPIAPAEDARPPECAALDTSLLSVPDWFAARCLGGPAVREAPPGGPATDVPGDLAHYKTIYPAPAGVKVAQLPSLNFTSFAVNSQPIFGMAFQPFSPHRLYAVDNTSRQLGLLEDTGVFTPIAFLNPDPGPSFTVTGIAFDGPSTCYLVATDGSPAGSRLFRLDISNAALTPVGTITGVPFVIDIAIDSLGQMWAHDIGSDSLLRVNKATGAPTLVGPTGLAANFAQGMMDDATDGTLYGCVYVTAPAQQGRLVRFDRSTGLATMLAGPVPDQMECALLHQSPPCAIPRFGGLRSATSAWTPSCAVRLEWSPATACPGDTIRYNVYRWIPPAAPQLLQGCVAGITYTDTAVVSGTRYTYRVRAEAGSCGGGNVDGNVVDRIAAPTGAPPVTDLDDVENGGGGWDTSGGTGSNAWAIVTTQSHSPTHAWFVAGPATASDRRLRRLAPVAVPAGGGELSFWHVYSAENSFDGHVVEYSLDGGATWSDILAGQGTLPANAARFLANGYDALIRPFAQSAIAGRQAWSGTVASFRQVRIDLGDFHGRTVAFRFRFVSDGANGGTGVWIDDVAVTLDGAPCVPAPAQAAEPLALAVDAGGNGVYQPNEAVAVAPAWRNTGSAAIALTGALTGHAGPAGPVYTIPDGAAAYGTIPAGLSASCTSTGNCYTVANAAAIRPAAHWDATALETVAPTGATMTWTLHVGESFTDVPPASPFFRFVETLLHRGITAGCGGAAYCPAATVTRDQMAVFVLVAKEGSSYAPPACVSGATLFADVPASSPFCRWIEELARRGIAGGCGGGMYCPAGATTRDQMAVFVLRTLDPALNPPACQAPLFADVPAASPFCRWIEELARRGVVSGCGGGNYCPGDPVRREQMSVFLTATFGLTLYGL